MPPPERVGAKHTTSEPVWAQATRVCRHPRSPQPAPTAPATASAAPTAMADHDQLPPGVPRARARGVRLLPRLLDRPRALEPGHRQRGDRTPGVGPAARRDPARVVAKAFAENVASVRVLTKNGFASRAPNATRSWAGTAAGSTTALWRAWPTRRPRSTLRPGRIPERGTVTLSVGGVTFCPGRRRRPLARGVAVSSRPFSRQWSPECVAPPALSLPPSAPSPWG